MFKRILVPLDGSPLAEGILPVVREFAVCGMRQLVLLRVAEHDVVSFLVDRPEVAQAVIEMDRAECRRYLERIADKLQSDGFETEIHVGEGPPAREIVEFAKRDIDLIAMSTHGRSGLGRWLMGSVADRVLHDAKVPVLLVRAHAERAHQM